MLVEAIKTFKNKNLKVEEKEERKKEEKGGGKKEGEGGEEGRKSMWNILLLVFTC